MAKVRFDFDGLDDAAKEKAKKKIFERIAKFLPNEIRKYLSKGESTVKGKGKLVAYKFPENYPGNLKASSPVNLKLTGDLYAAIKARIGNKLEVGVFDKKNAAKAQGLIKGDTRGSGGGARLAGPRPFMPSKTREVFRDEIQRKIVDIVVEEVTKVIKKTSR